MNKKIIGTIIVTLATQFTTPVFAENMINSSYEESSNKSWEIFDIEKDVPSNRIWNIKFSRNFNRDEIKSIYILQGDKEIDVNIDNGNSIGVIVSPVNKFDKGEEYSLRCILNNGNKYRKDFQISNKDVEEITINSLINIDNISELRDIEGYLTEEKIKDGVNLKTYRTANYSDFTMIEGKDKVSEIYTTDKTLMQKYGITKGMRGSDAKKIADERPFGHRINVYADKNDRDKVYAIRIIKDMSYRSSKDTELAEYEIFHMTNAFRGSYRLKPFIWNGNLADCAKKHSKDMVVRNYFDHNSPDLSFFDRIQRDVTEPFSGWGENIVMVGFGASKAVDIWVNSAGHRHNMLNEFTHMGVGTYLNNDGYFYSTQVFGTRN